MLKITSWAKSEADPSGQNQRTSKNLAEIKPSDHFYAYYNFLMSFIILTNITEADPDGHLP